MSGGTVVTGVKATTPLGVGASLPDVLDRRVVAPPQEGSAGLARGDAATSDFAVRLGDRAGVIGHVLPPSILPRSGASGSDQA